MTDYDDTDYGPNNDGVTDYNTPSQIITDDDGDTGYGGSNDDDDDDDDNDDDDDWDD